MNAILDTLHPVNLTDLNAARIRRLVERASDLERRIAPLAEELKEIKAFFRDAPDGEYLGRDHKVVVKTVDATRLDEQQVRLWLTPGQFIECCKVTTSTRVTVKEVK